MFLKSKRRKIPESANASYWQILLFLFYKNVDKHFGRTTLNPLLKDQNEAFRILLKTQLRGETSLLYTRGVTTDVNPRRSANKNFTEVIFLTVTV
jgi:hypothetical protein